MKKAIVLCSGGLDSIVTAFYVKNKLHYKNLTILFFNYSQRALNNERKYAKTCAKDLKAEFVEVELKNLGEMSNSLINKPGKVRKLSDKDLKNTKSENEKWYVPFRNTIFISYAVSLAENLGDTDIFLGFKSEGKEPFPDTTIEYVKQMNKLTKVASQGKINILAPLIEKDKEDIISLGIKLGVDFRKTFSCYLGKKEHCGYCLACKLRQAGFYWANIKDSTIYLSSN